MFQNIFKTHPYQDLKFAETASTSELKRLDRSSTTLHVEAGTVLMQQGSYGNEALLLLEGELVVERDNEAVAVLTPGVAVGETALLLNEPRNATVRAATDVTVLALSRSEFNTVLDSCPNIARTILDAAFNRALAAA